MNLKLFSKAYLIVLLSLIYFPSQGVVDMKAAQNFYLSIINVSFFGLIMIHKDKLDLKLFSNKILKTYSIFFLICCLSTIVAINKTESLVRITDLFMFLSTLIILLYIHRNKLIDLINFGLYMFVSLLFVDVVTLFITYINIESFSEFTFGRSDKLSGIYGNKNIKSVSIGMKTPFIIILLLKHKQILYRGMLLILLTMSFYSIFLLSSRAVFVSIFTIIIFLFIAFLVKTFFYNRNIRSDFKPLLLYIIPLILSFILFTVYVNQSDSINVEERINTIINSDEDRSISERLRFYNQSIDYIRKKPILGYGIGNWKIYSIQADSSNMASYIVPYFTHNDFLEIFVETGIFGFIFYLIFFFYLFKINYLNVIDWFKNNRSIEVLFLSMFLIFYFIDSNLNFPLDRASMQIQFALYIFMLINYSTINENK